MSTDIGQLRVGIEVLEIPDGKVIEEALAAAVVDIPGDLVAEGMGND